MRLWHYKLIKYLPRQQLVAQWRELNSIFAKQDNHILINYLYEYDKNDLINYAHLVLEEFSSRGYHINSFSKFLNYFNGTQVVKNPNPFKNHHNDEYLKICAWNLYEKYIRGQEGFTEESIQFIKNIIFEGE